MRLSSKGDYGIRALIDLAQHQGGGPIPSNEIALRQGIPESLVGQILGSLRLAGFVRSVRGAQGGHTLARDPELMRMDEVVESLEGPVSPGACLEHPDLNCTGSAGQLQMWKETRQAILAVLRSRTVADLAKEEPVTGGGRYSI